MKLRSTIFLFLVFGACAGAAESGVKVKPGELIIDHPTLINLGFEWLIQGDDNRNAQVEVSYRKQGETQWKQGLPLLRLQGLSEDAMYSVSTIDDSPEGHMGKLSGAYLMHHGIQLRLRGDYDATAIKLDRVQ